MTFTKSKRLAVIAVAVVAAVIIADQFMKFWIKTHFYLGEDYEIFSWFHLRFIQNNGMAFGFEFGSKLLLTLFRIILVCFLCWYMNWLVKKAKVSCGYMISVALVAAGALGNIIDCVAYGEIFTNPAPPHVAMLVPWGEGYGTLFHGLVVDMLYFPLFSFTWPEWLPWLGGQDFSFFDPVFNIADAAITVGMFMIILFYSKYLSFEEGEKPKKV